MTSFRHHRPDSNHRTSCKPQLEVLEARDLPSLSAAIQDIPKVVSDTGVVVSDWTALKVDQVKLFYYEELNKMGLASSESVSQAQTAVNNDQNALSKAESTLGNDWSDLWQNIQHPFSPIPSQAPASQSSPSQSTTPWVGTFSGKLTPDWNLSNDPGDNGPWTVTLKIKADGSGSISVTSFDGGILNSPGSFDAGSVSASSNGDGTYTIIAGSTIINGNPNLTFSVTATLNGNTISFSSAGGLDVYDYTNYNELFFDSGQLTRQ
jgi:hypothetical protein